MFTKTKPPQPDEPLGERIEKFRSELETHIEGKVRELKLECPNVPEGVLRNLISHRAPGCLCLQVLQLEQQS
jgi:hypothetical protein